MSITIEAIYEADVLKPLTPLSSLKDKTRVRLTIEPQEQPAPRVRRIAEATPDYSRERAWIEAHGHEYIGQWVVLDGDRLLGHSADYKEALRITSEAEQSASGSILTTFLQDASEPFCGAWL
jgi:predicted DNA-binding antitoxin AbrB/MazE fold protein